MSTMRGFPEVRGSEAHSQQGCVHRRVMLVHARQSQCAQIGIQFRLLNSVTHHVFTPWVVLKCWSFTVSQRGRVPSRTTRGMGTVMSYSGHIDQWNRIKLFLSRRKGIQQKTTNTFLVLFSEFRLNCRRVFSHIASLLSHHQELRLLL